MDEIFRFNPREPHLNFQAAKIPSGILDFRSHRYFEFRFVFQHNWRECVCVCVRLDAAVKVRPENKRYHGRHQ